MKPGRELDRLVAEVIGIPIYPYDDIKHNHAWLNDPANYPHLTSGEGEYLILWWKSSRREGDLWTPSSDNDLAIWAWEWLEKNNPWGQVALSRNSEGLPCVLQILPPVSFEGGGFFVDEITSGESYPHAICLAVLATKEAGNET